MAVDSDIDMVSDLNGTGDTTVNVHEGDNATHGADAVQVDNRKPAAVATKVAPEPVAEGDKPASLRDQISSALKGETDTPDAAKIDGPVRNADGTFAAKPAEVLDPNAPVIEAAPAVAAPVGIDPEVFKSLPAETQASLARTMDGIAQSQQRFATLAPIEQLIAPRVEAWAMNGIAPAQALHQLLALSDFATRDTAGFIKHIADANGIDLEELVLGAEPVDPQYKELQDKFNALQSQVQGQTQQQAQAAHNDMVTKVTAFASEKGPDGKPLRPYWGDLATEVLPFISALIAQNPNMPHNEVLSQAYDRACWATPSVRSKMQAAAQAAGEAERLRAAAERTGKARDASVSVAPGAPTSAPLAADDKSRSLRDSIKASISAHS